MSVLAHIKHFKNGSFCHIAYCSTLKGWSEKTGLASLICAQMGEVSTLVSLVCHFSGGSTLAAYTRRDTS